jgi:hypothetical protein
MMRIKSHRGSLKEDPGEIKFIVTDLVGDNTNRGKGELKLIY